MNFSQRVRLINLNWKWIPSVNCFDRCGIHILKEQFRPDKFSQKCLRKNEINIFEGANKTAKGPHSATMIILVDLPSSKGRDAIETSLLFTHRAAKMKNHANEISLPGGTIEKNESVEIAALRETEEEIGLDRSKLEIWGQLPSIIRPYNKGKTSPVVSRFIGDVATFESQLRPEEGEVQGIFLVPITELINSIRFTAFRIDGQLRGDLAMFYRMPAFIVSEFKVLYPSTNEKYLPNRRLIWGLTAITIYEMLLSISQLNDLMMKHK